MAPPPSISILPTWAPSLPVETTRKASLINPPTEPNQRWWWDQCVPSFIAMLEASQSYTADDMAAHLRVIRDIVIPSFGPPTPKAQTKSLQTYDHSPFEISWNLSLAGDVIRFTFEPLGDKGGSAEDPFCQDVVPTLIPSLTQVSDKCDMRWFTQTMNYLFLRPDEYAVAKQNLPLHLARAPQCFLAFDLKAGKRTLKAYFFPILKHFATGRSTEDITFDLISQLDPLGPQFKPAADKLAHYLATCAEPCPVEMMAIDCSDPAQARVKVYARVRANSLAVLRDVLTLGGAQTDELTMQGVAEIAKFWHLMLDEPAGMADDQSKPARIEHTLHKGICFGFEMKAGSDHVDVKTYAVPWQSTPRDSRVVANFADALATVGIGESAGKFTRGMGAVAALSTSDFSKRGAFTYIAYSHTKNGPYFSVYVSPKALGHASEPN